MKTVSLVDAKIREQTVAIAQAQAVLLKPLIDTIRHQAAEIDALRRDLDHIARHLVVDDLPSRAIRRPDA
jgi:hypothetical protein